MAKRKFGGLRNELEKVREPNSNSADDGKGRTPGKSGNPAWTQHTVMLEKSVHRAARQLLLQQDDGTDMSDLLNHLLADWVSQHQAKV
jgi:hypothetical protein